MIGREFEEALQPLGSTLAADGFSLQVAAGSRDGQIVLTVKAGADACATCLIPEDMFTVLAADYLNARGLHPEILVVYPEAGGEGVCPI